MTELKVNCSPILMVILKTKKVYGFTKNFGANTLPQFYLQDKNFLQKNTLEVGRESKPILVDINNDQLQDLLQLILGNLI